jgi:hypothetical protein
MEFLSFFEEVICKIERESSGWIYLAQKVPVVDTVTNL